MDLNQINAAVKGLSDQELQMAMQDPTSPALRAGAGALVLAEMQSRRDARAAQQAQQQTGPLSQQILQQLASMQAPMGLPAPSGYAHGGAVHGYAPGGPIIGYSGDGLGTAAGAFVPPRPQYPPHMAQRWDYQYGSTHNPDGSPIDFYSGAPMAPSMPARGGDMGRLPGEDPLPYYYGGDPVISADEMQELMSPEAAPYMPMLPPPAVTPEPIPGSGAYEFGQDVADWSQRGTDNFINVVGRSINEAGRAGLVGARNFFSGMINGSDYGYDVPVTPPSGATLDPAEQPMLPAVDSYAGWVPGMDEWDEPQAGEGGPDYLEEPRHPDPEVMSGIGALGAPDQNWGSNAGVSGAADPALFIDSRVTPRELWANPYGEDLPDVDLDPYDEIVEVNGPAVGMENVPPVLRPRDEGEAPVDSTLDPGAEADARRATTPGPGGDVVTTKSTLPGGLSPGSGGAAIDAAEGAAEMDRINGEALGRYQKVRTAMDEMMAAQRERREKARYYAMMKAGAAIAGYGGDNSMKALASGLDAWSDTMDEARDQEIEDLAGNAQAEAALAEALYARDDVEYARAMAKARAAIAASRGGDPMAGFNSFLEDTYGRARVAQLIEDGVFDSGDSEGIRNFMFNEYILNRGGMPIRTVPKEEVEEPGLMKRWFGWG